MILANVLTKADLNAPEAAIETQIAALSAKVVGFKKEGDAALRELELRMTVKLGAIIAVAVAAIAPLRKLL